MLVDWLGLLMYLYWHCQIQGGGVSDKPLTFNILLHMDSDSDSDDSDNMDSTLDPVPFAGPSSDSAS